MIYFDTAYLARFYLCESGTEAVRKLAESADGVASCELIRLEMAAVFHRKLREGSLSKSIYNANRKQFKQDCESGVWTLFPISPGLIETTVEKIGELPPTVFLRAGDALHLATAAEQGFKEIYSNDRHLLAAAKHFGLKGVDVI